MGMCDEAFKSLLEKHFYFYNHTKNTNDVIALIIATNKNDYRNNDTNNND